MNEGLHRFLLSILALLFPPVAVFVKAGNHWQLYLNLFFCLLLYIPAVLHALWFVRHRPRTRMLGPDEFDDLDCTDSLRVEPKLDW